jgi:hypothetical protein
VNSVYCMSSMRLADYRNLKLHHRRASVPQAQKKLFKRTSCVFIGGAP